jgi:hypothetical protein
VAGEGASPKGEEAVVAVLVESPNTPVQRDSLRLRLTG